MSKIIVITGGTITSKELNQIKELFNVDEVQKEEINVSGNISKQIFQKVNEHKKCSITLSKEIQHLKLQEEIFNLFS